MKVGTTETTSLKFGYKLGTCSGNPLFHPGLWSRKSCHPTPTPGNFDYPTPTPTPTFSCISYLK